MTTKTVGVGAITAGITTQRRLATHEFHAVVYVGTCGVFPGGEPARPNDVVVARQARLYDIGVCHARADIPDPVTTQLDMHEPMVDALLSSVPEARLGVVGSTIGSINHRDVALAVRNHTGAEFDCPEAFGVVQACTIARVPVALVLGLTHTVGPVWKRDWSKHHLTAARAAGAAAIRWAMRGAQGI